MDTIILNNGVEIPALGFGVFQTPPDETRDAVRAALDCGYRHIDTAAAYGNERQVGEAVHSSDADRSEVFLETKVLDQRLRLRRVAARLRQVLTRKNVPERTLCFLQHRWRLWDYVQTPRGPLTWVNAGSTRELRWNSVDEKVGASVALKVMGLCLNPCERVTGSLDRDPVSLPIRGSGQLRSTPDVLRSAED